MKIKYVTLKLYLLYITCRSTHVLCPGLRLAVVRRTQGARISARFPCARQERHHTVEHETRRIRAPRASPLPRGTTSTHSAQS